MTPLANSMYSFRKQQNGSFTDKKKQNYVDELERKQIKELEETEMWFERNMM